MTAYDIAAPDYTSPTEPNAVNRIQDFQLLERKQVRTANGDTTPAWELTFKVPSGLKFSKDELGKGVIAAGMQIALLPVNDTARVEKALAGLKQDFDPSEKISIKLPKRDGEALPDQPLTRAQAIAHTIDMTRPTKELLKLAGIKSDEYDYVSVEDFLNMPGVKGRITFDQLIKNQQPLANRKYTPSRVDPEKGEIGIIVSEVHHDEYRGTGSGYLADVAQMENPPTVKGFLDLRKHKLPYDYEKPMIMLSTGVGVAPHLAMLREAEQKGLKPDIRMFVNGGRNDGDELCGDEIRKLMGDNVDNYHYMASRRNGYVQEALLADPEAVWHALEKDKGSIYLCGLEQMKTDVLQTLAKIGDDHGINGEEWVESLKADKRIRESTSAPDRFRTKWEEAQAKREPEPSTPGPGK